jgi:pyrroloquinoline quinone biosynthesis protein D
VTALDAASVPRLAPGVRLQYDRARSRWILQAPERVLVPDETGLAVLQRLDGCASVDQIAQRLAAEYDAPLQVIRNDVLALLQELAGKGLVSA